MIDPKTDTVVSTIDGGGGLEFGVSDEAGKFYVDGEKNNEIVRMDLTANAADAHWPLAGCTTPHGLAIDRSTMRLFASCANKTMVVMNAANGAVISSLPIGAGTDFAEFDASRHLAFSSNRDGNALDCRRDVAGRIPGACPCADQLRCADDGRRSENRQNIPRDSRFHDERRGTGVGPRALCGQAGFGEAALPGSGEIGAENVRKPRRNGR